MSRNKNAIRKHEIGVYTAGTATTEPENYVELAKYITEITDDTDETTDDFADYAGDGTPSSDIVSVAEKWTVVGLYDPDDPAQKMIAKMKRKLGDERKLWHKITQTDGTVVTGVATVTEIKAGSGEASAYEEFGCVLNYDQIPTESVTP